MLRKNRYHAELKLLVLNFQSMTNSTKHTETTFHNLFLNIEHFPQPIFKHHPPIDTDLS